MRAGQRTTNNTQLTSDIFKWSLVNLLIVSLIGIFLRSIPVFDFGVSYYKNTLHAHSHFAFGGWVMPALYALFLKYFPEITSQITHRHLRNIGILILVSAFGMLFSFPFQGYGSISIVFSTLSILATFYLAWVVWKAKRTKSVATKYLMAGLFFMVLSSIGPFGTVPLIIKGQAGSELYFNAIYFYLHFQYNGWFTFMLLAILYRMIGDKPGFGIAAFNFFLVACVPTYFLSILWIKPAAIFYWVGGIAAFLQLVAIVFLLKDISHSKKNGKTLSYLVKLSLVIFIIKNVLQFAGAFPFIAELAYAYRNFIIGYLHLVLIGWVTIFIFGVTSKLSFRDTSKSPGLVVFIVAWIITEGLLFSQAILAYYNVIMPYFDELILIFSCLFPLSIAWIISRSKLLGLKLA